MAISSQVEVESARLDPEPHGVRTMALRLSEEEQGRAARFRFERDRRRFVVARARLRELLAQRLGAPPEAIAFAYAASGKPRLAGRFARSGWRFNLSRRDELAVYAFSRSSEVGIDVEPLQPVREADAIVERIFSAAEKDAYFALGPEARPLGFLRCWTRKEALGKALGIGVSRVGAELDTEGALPGWQLSSYSPLPGFIAALAHRE